MMEACWAGNRVDTEKWIYLFLSLEVESPGLSYGAGTEGTSTVTHGLLEWSPEILIFFHMPASSFQTPARLSYNSIQFWYYPPRDSVRFCRLGAQSWRTALFTSHPHFRCQSQVQVVICASDQLDINLRFPWFPPQVELIYARTVNRTQGNTYVHLPAY